MSRSRAIRQYTWNVRRSAPLVVGALAALAIAGCGDDASEAGGGGGGDFQIGVIGNFSGTDPQSSEDMLRGAEMAVADVNEKGGVNGQNLKLVVKDGEFKTQASVDAAHALIDVTGVSATLMYGGSDIQLAVAPYAKAKNSLILNSASTAPELKEYGGTIFSVLASDDQLVPALVDMAGEAGHTQVALMYPNNTFGKSFGDTAEKAIAAAGGSVVANVAYSEGSASYRSQLQRVKDANPDAILSAGYGTDSRTIFKDARLIGLDAPWYLLYPTIFVVENEKWLDGRAFGVDIAAQSLDQAAALKTRYEEKHQRAPQPVAYYGYDAISALASAAATAGDTSADALRDALGKGTFEGVTGSIVFAEDGSREEAPFDEVEYVDGVFTQRAE